MVDNISHREIERVSKLIFVRNGSRLNAANNGLQVRMSFFTREIAKTLLTAWVICIIQIIFNEEVNTWIFIKNDGQMLCHFIRLSY